MTTTDLLKAAALVFVLIDHVGLFFDPDETWWRVFGRAAAPIFFFLIGYARRRAVPWTWLALGAALTITDLIASGGLDDVSLNILLNFALLRWLVLPLVAQHVMPHPWRLAALLALCVAAIPASSLVLEYGTEGWLWSLFGLASRTAEAAPKTAWTRVATAAVASAIYVVREIQDYELDGAQSVVLATLVLSLVLALLRFRRAPLDWKLPRPLAALLRFCGRHSLEIYGLSLFAMQLLSYGLDIGDSDNDGEDDGEAA